MLSSLSFTPTFPKTKERPKSPVAMIVSDTEEPQDGDEDGEDDKSLSELSLSQSLNTSSADTVSVSQNSQPPALEEEDNTDLLEATQIVDQSDPPSPDPQSLARDQNSNKSKEKSLNSLISLHREIQNPGANYWMNEMIKSRTKPKELDIEDPNFPFNPSSSQKMNLNQSPVETLKDFLGEISLTDQLVKTGVRHPAELTRGRHWAKLKKKNRNLFLDKLSGGEGDGEPATSSSSSKAGKRSRSSSSEETPGPSTSTSTTSPVTSRLKRRKMRDETQRKSSSPDPATPNTPNTPRGKGKKEPPMGTCPICNRSMKCSVLEIHAGEAVTD